MQTEKPFDVLIKEVIEKVKASENKDDQKQSQSHKPGRSNVTPTGKATKEEIEAIVKNIM